MPTDLLPLRDFLEVVPARVVTSGLLVTSVLLVIVYSSAELMGTSESCSVGIANRPDELALPKVAVLFEDISQQKGKVMFVQILICLFASHRKSAEQYGADNL